MTFFENFTPKQVARISAAGSRLKLPKDWSPIWERTPADKAYIILEGRVSVRRHQEEIAQLGPGDIMGEAALVAHTLRTASIVALTPLEVIHFTAEAVADLSAEMPAFKQAIEDTVAERLGRNDAAAHNEDGTESGEGHG